VAEDLTRYLDGEIDAQDRRRVEVHITSCAHCRDAVREMELTLAVLGWLDPEQLPSSITSAPEQVAAVKHEAGDPAGRNA
jgi:predicted anti-sigma-YlaC factor YlaD